LLFVVVVAFIANETGARNVADVVVSIDVAVVVLPVCCFYVDSKWQAARGGCSLGGGGVADGVDDDVVAAAIAIAVAVAVAVADDDDDDGVVAKAVSKGVTMKL